MHGEFDSFDGMEIDFPVVELKSGERRSLDKETLAEVLQKITVGALEVNVALAFLSKLEPGERLAALLGLEDETHFRDCLTCLTLNADALEIRMILKSGSKGEGDERVSHPFQGPLDEVPRPGSDQPPFWYRPSGKHGIDRIRRSR